MSFVATDLCNSPANTLSNLHSPGQITGKSIDRVLCSKSPRPHEPPKVFRTSPNLPRNYFGTLGESSRRFEGFPDSFQSYSETTRSFRAISNAIEPFADIQNHTEAIQHPPPHMFSWSPQCSRLTRRPRFHQNHHRKLTRWFQPVDACQLTTTELSW